MSTSVSLEYWGTVLLYGIFLNKQRSSSLSKSTNDSGTLFRDKRGLNWEDLFIWYLIGGLISLRCAWIGKGDFKISLNGIIGACLLKEEKQLGGIGGGGMSGGFTMNVVKIDRGKTGSSIWVDGWRISVDEVVGFFKFSKCLISITSTFGLLRFWKQATRTG